MGRSLAFVVGFSLSSACLAVTDGKTSDNTDLVNDLAKCSATHTTNIMILRAGGQNTDRLVPVTEWFYNAAVALSSEGTTKGLFTAHYKRYLATNGEIQKMNKDAQLIAAKKFLATLNHDMDDCDQLKSANEALLSRYLKKP